MPKPNPNAVSLATRLRAAAGVPAEDALSIVEGAPGRITVSAPSPGGPFHGNFESVKNKLAMAVALRAARNGSQNAAEE